ncbi:hypothetical protein WAF17_16960 [Bernardetia sp. ABR2-2B]|uniref:hypothetical protein n=1 Tax=Bernardetia sp. ABR2-2B TaxID=3127472 RepID=UPI0030CB91E6
MNTSLPSQNISLLVEELESLRKDFNFDKKEDKEEFYKKNNLLFAYVSANISRLMPQIPYPKHKIIFEKLLFNLQLLNIEEQNPTLFAPHFEFFDTTKNKDILQKSKEGKPFLFCCFHLGSYSLLPTLFTYNDLDFGFLLNQNLMDRKAESFSKGHKILCKRIENERKTNVKSEMQLINVEEKKGIWQAIKMLKKGKSLIVYADGNTGTNSVKKEKENTVRVKFLGENLLVKQGIAFLSYLCKVPIVPVISNRVNEKIEFSLKRKFEFLPVIYPPNFEDKKTEKEVISKEEFAVQTMQELYTSLEKEICKNKKDIEQVSQWEGWIFVNKFFGQLQKPMTSKVEVQKEQLNASYIFNEARFALIESNKNDKKNEKKTLFDKYTYRFFPVSDLLFEIITYFSVPKKLYLFVTENNQANQASENDSNSPVSIDSSSELEILKTNIPISALEKLINKNILVESN